MDESTYNRKMVNLRERIDGCDYRLALEFAHGIMSGNMCETNAINLLEERLKHCVHIGELKAEFNYEIRVNGREEEVIANYVDVFEDYNLPKRTAKKIATTIMFFSRELQKELNNYQSNGSVSSSP